ncbi:extracellular dioxygenase [Drechmeria coniospora]|uniref:Extracellular dioxygenase n=1 Tax=Drechmeria coniospora TaxID=98403 RepID=A0A151GW25_DRECN|nr:extracellular dioxygenase [Drechmeria coniospora]KYK61232.1 extracellular dioxygenase [Drechmeria coniospora]
MAKLSTLMAILALSVATHGHPSTEEAEQAYFESRRQVVANTKHNLEKCINSPASRALRNRAVARRAARATELRQRFGIKTAAAAHVRRDSASLEKWASISHDYTASGFDLNTPTDVIFASNTTCALVPETIIGPYFVDGELLRTDITDGEPGVRTHVDFQFINIKTCEPVPELVIDVWQANSTGVYSGVSAPSQGGLKTNFGRGIQVSNSDGVVEFDTIFPGHYVGRTNHIHVMSTDQANLLLNGTFEGGTVRHIGQTYFDQSLIAAVEAVEPYVRNKQNVTSNLQDKYTGDQATPEYDPFFKHVYLGDSVDDGILVWLTIGLDLDANYNKNRTPAAHWHPGGGTDKRNGTGTLSSEL